MESGDAMSEVGTLKELGVQVGDVVEHLQFADASPARQHHTIHYIRGGYYGVAAYEEECKAGMQHFRMDSGSKFSVVSRATPPLRTWGELPPTEKGALLLAHNDAPGSVEFWSVYGWMPLNNLGWLDRVSYRHKPQPKIETVTAYYRMDWTGQMIVDHNDNCGEKGPFRITFQTIDGKPDCASVKMEEV